MSILLTGERTAGEAVTAILKTPMDGTWVASIDKIKKTMSGKQRGSLHIWCQAMADELNDRGFTYRIEGINMDLDWGMYDVKRIFKRVGDSQFERESTEHLTTKELQHVFKLTSKRFSEIYGIYIEWPSDEPPLLQEHDIR